MKFLLTLDYELYFGANTGTPDGCLIYPTRVLTKELERHGFLMTLFVDAGYLDRLARSQESLHKFQLERISSQLQQLVSRGHDVQLHVHPHWEDTHWTNGKWEINTSRYRLQSFSSQAMTELLERYTGVLSSITGIRPTAFRAGGWCLQPFETLADPLANAGIHIDSTVYTRGKSVNPGREFDFSSAPDLDRWVFGADPLSVQETGRFLEIPITACRVSPFFYWEAFWKKLVKPAGDRPLGDGYALSNSKEYYVRKLFQSEDTVASIDGARAHLLEHTYQKTRERRHTILNVMGHPKSLTRNSILALNQFLSRRGAELESSVLRDFAHTLPGFNADVLPAETVIAYNTVGQG